MKIAKVAGMFLLPTGLVLATTGCGGNDLLANPNPSPSPSETAAAPTFTAEQQEAWKYCLSADEQKALQPGAAEADSKLLDSCRKLGQSIYDGMANVNKTQEQIAKLANELKTTTSLARATQIVNSLGEAKKINDEGVTVSDQQALAAQIRGMFPNADQNDILVGSTGEGAINPAAHKVDTGGAPFYNGNNITYLDSTDAIAKWLASGTPEANTAKERVTSAIKAAGKDDKEVNRALTGAGYIPVQLKGESQIMGGSYFVDGKFHIEDSWRQSQAGDIYWLYITADGMLVSDATLRADCGNVGAKQIRIVKINIPPAVPVGLPPGKEECPEGTVLQPNGECHTPPPPVVPPVVPPVTPVCPPGTTGTPPNCIERKIPSQGSGPQGNAPVGGGRNDTSGPGTYIPPQEMQQPPAVQPPPPAAPAPQPAPITQPAPGGGTVVVPAPNPNPAGPRPIATPEPAAPAPSQAPDTCVPAPGKTSC
ncbi:hypothetical protein D3C73_15070 [compost metagenome]